MTDSAFDPMTVRDAPALSLFVTATAAYCNNNPVPVPFDSNPRIAAIAAGLTVARQMGRPVRAELYGLGWPVEVLILTPEGQVHQAHLPAAEQTAAADPPILTTGIDEATVLDDDPWDDFEDDQLDGAGEQPESAIPSASRAQLSLVPSAMDGDEDFDPTTVPAWPQLAIALDGIGSATVQGEPVQVQPGEEPRAAAIAAAAAYVVRLGLSRPVRALASDPNGTEWPLIIHPDGTATPAGEPRRIESGRRRFRRAE